MKLKEYLILTRLTPIDFAYSSGVDINAIYRAVHGIRIGMKNARMIEEASNGNVRAEELLEGRQRTDWPPKTKK